MIWADTAAATGKEGKNFLAQSVDATTYGVLLTRPTLCVVPSAVFVTIRSSTLASLVIVPASAAAAFVYSARTASPLTSKSSAPICA